MCWIHAQSASKIYQTLAHAKIHWVQIEWNSSERSFRDSQNNGMCDKLCFCLAPNRIPNESRFVK